MKFATTKPLPTYLVALLVGDFQCSEGSTDGIPIRICTTPDKVGLTKFAVDAAAKELHFFNDWIGIKYPFEKLDVIGIPDFAAGAMEYAAAMTFRESDLLVDEKNGSIQSKRRVADVIAHELAHQWFGDLVTCRDWGEGWLNEGFATYSEYLWREHHEGRDAADLELDEWAEMYFGEDASRYRRFHVILGDSNMSGWATAMKIGTTALVLDLIERGKAPELEIAQPVDANRSISRDQTCDWIIELKDGRKISAIDVQRIYLSAASKLWRDPPDDEHA